MKTDIDISAALSLAAEGRVEEAIALLGDMAAVCPDCDEIFSAVANCCGNSVVALKLLPIISRQFRSIRRARLPGRWKWRARWRVFSIPICLIPDNLFLSAASHETVALHEHSGSLIRPLWSAFCSSAQKSESCCGLRLSAGDVPNIRCSSSTHPCEPLRSRRLVIPMMPCRAFLMYSMTWPRSERPLMRRLATFRPYCVRLAMITSEELMCFIVLCVCFLTQSYQHGCAKTWHT